MAPYMSTLQIAVNDGIRDLPAINVSMPCPATRGNEKTAYCWFAGVMRESRSSIHRTQIEKA